MEKLNLGGMSLEQYCGDVDIYYNGRRDEGVRIQRADLEDVIDFLKQAQKDRI